MTGCTGISSQQNKKLPRPSTGESEKAGKTVILSPVLNNGQVAPASPVARSPPVVPPRNGSKLEHSPVANPLPPTNSKPEQKLFDTKPEPGGAAGSAAGPRASNLLPAADSGDVTDKSANTAGPANTYRDNWKARNESQNTLIFNFVNSKKDLSHIENDGLDLSKRTKQSKKVTMRMSSVSFVQ